MWDWSENQIELIMIRHGATKANEEHRYLGNTDESLSVQGITILQKEKNNGTYPMIDKLFTSPMKRCIQTVEILYPDIQPVIVPDWREMDFGDFEGKNYQDLQEDPRYQKWIDSNGTLPFPNGESRENFIKRSKQGLYAMCKELSKTVRSADMKYVVIGMIVHGGTIMALLSSFYGGEYFDHQTANGKGYGCKLCCDGEHIHFEDLREL